MLLSRLFLCIQARFCIKFSMHSFLPIDPILPVHRHHFDFIAIAILDDLLKLRILHYSFDFIILATNCILWQRNQKVL